MINAAPSAPPRPNSDDSNKNPAVGAGGSPDPTPTPDPASISEPAVTDNPYSPPSPYAESLRQKVSSGGANSKSTIDSVPASFLPGDPATNLGSSSGGNSDGSDENKDNKPKKKSFLGGMSAKMVLGAVLLLILVVGSGAGLYLSQRSQDIRQEARMANCSEFNSQASCPTANGCTWTEAREANCNNLSVASCENYEGCQLSSFEVVGDPNTQYCQGTYTIPGSCTGTYRDDADSPGSPPSGQSSTSTTPGCDNGVPIGGTACQTQGENKQYRCGPGSYTPGGNNWIAENCSSGQTCQGSACAGGGGGGGTGPNCSSCVGSCGATGCNTNCDANTNPRDDCGIWPAAFMCEKDAAWNTACNDQTCIKDSSGKCVTAITDYTNPASWCKKFQFDSNAPNNAVSVVYVGNNGQVCVEGSGCNRDNLDWNCATEPPAGTYSAQCLAPLPQQVGNLKYEFKVDGTAPKNFGQAVFYLSLSRNSYPNHQQGFAELTQWLGKPTWSNDCTSVDWCGYWLHSFNDPNPNASGHSVSWTWDGQRVLNFGGQANITINSLATKIKELKDAGKLPANYRIRVGGEFRLPPNETKHSLGDPQVDISPYACAPAPTTPPPTTPPPQQLSCNSTCVPNPNQNPCPSGLSCLNVAQSGQAAQYRCRNASYPAQQDCKPPAEPLKCNSVCINPNSPTAPKVDQCQTDLGPNYACVNTGAGIYRCRHSSYPGEASCQPPAPMCLSISMNPSTPALNSQVIFTCGQVSGVSNYGFRVIQPNGAIEELSANGNVSLPYTITQSGAYRAECRLCATPNCEDWPTDGVAPPLECKESSQCLGLMTCANNIAPSCVEGSCVCGAPGQSPNDPPPPLPPPGGGISCVDNAKCADALDCDIGVPMCVEESCTCSTAGLSPN